MTEAIIVGRFEKAEGMRLCGSSMAHNACRFAGQQMQCAASSEVYDGCPYNQRGYDRARYE